MRTPAANTSDAKFSRQIRSIDMERNPEDEIAFMPSRLPRRIQIALSIPSSFVNWIGIYRHILRGAPLSQLELRSGEVIRGMPDTQLWNHYNDIWNRRSYTDHFVIPEAGTVIDIGANVGIFTLLAARSARLVHAFEPEPRNFQLLEQNCRGETNVIVHNEAVGGLDGTAVLTNQGSSTGFSLFGQSGAAAVCNVTVRTLSSVLSDYGIGYCDFLKLDCEGAEFPILLNSPPDLFRQIGTIAMEFHDHLSGHSHAEIVKRLQTLGFKTAVHHVSGSYGMISARR